MKLLLVAWLSALLLSSQTSKERELPQHALQLLRSSTLADRAWGAYLCGALLVDDCGFPLLEHLEHAAVSVNAPADGEQFFYVQALLDSLIRLEGVTVPPPLLLRFDPRWRDEVIILLARSRAAATEAPLLQLDEQELTTAERTAVNNLLLRIRSRAFFLRTLKQTNIDHHFYVFDVEKEFGTLGPGIGDGVYSPKVVRKVPAGFPPVGVYELNSMNSGRVNVLLAEGPCCGINGNTTYTRIEIAPTGTQVQPRSRYAATASIECRNAYLSTFNGMSLETGNTILRPSANIRWTTRGPLAIPIHVHVLDHRQNKTIPLPTLQPQVVRLE